MNNKQLKKYLEKHYWKNKQWLNLTAWIDEKYCKKRNNYFCQEVCCDDITFLEIRTWDYFSGDPNRIAYTPYCEKAEWTGYLITVPKYGELTDEDISKAIHYVFRHELKLWLLFNIKFEKRRMNHPPIQYYKYDTETIRDYQNCGIIK